MAQEQHKEVASTRGPLVLTRADDEGIYVAGPALIRVRRASGQTKVAIWAADEVHIIREELLPQSIDLRKKQS